VSDQKCMICGDKDDGPGRAIPCRRQECCVVFRMCSKCHGDILGSAEMVADIVREHEKDHDDDDFVERCVISMLPAVYAEYVQNLDNRDLHPEQMADDAFEIADAMLSERRKRRGYI